MQNLSMSARRPIGIRCGAGRTNALLEWLAGENKAVLRLWRSVCARSRRRRSAALREHGVEFEIIPGITGDCRGGRRWIPVTCTGQSPISFAVVTGHEDPENRVRHAMGQTGHGGRYAGVFDGVEKPAPYHDTADCQRRAADTPAAVIRWGMTPQQKTLITTVGNAVADGGAGDDFCWCGGTLGLVFCVGTLPVGAIVRITV